MEHPIRGLHHVTATVDDAQDDLDFCLDVLGLRLVKKTVNFDNHHVYHFYYGDERGTPGTIWTTFPYKGHGVRVGKKGVGQVTQTAFSVPQSSLGFWRSRLDERGIAAQEITRFGDEAIAVSDPSGLRFELIGTDADDRTPWTGARIDGTAAIRGLHSVTMVVRSPQATLDLMRGLLGYDVIDETDGRIRVGVAKSAPGHLIDIVHSTNDEVALNGLGTVHHVAMAIANADEQRRLREELIQYGCKVTEVRDRCYFESIYFREPGGVLFEVATVRPGFTVDESLDQLGRELKLPPWEEPHRAAIEQGLPPIRPASLREA